MHIIIAFLTAAAGVIWALYRLQNSGVDLNAFNPFAWVRRRSWEKRFGVKPLHRLEKPMEVAAVLVVAALRSEGEMSREQKNEAIDMFESEFKLSRPDAAELFSSSAFLLQDCLDFSAEVRHILAPSKGLFSSEQAESTLSLLKRAALLDGEVSREQQAIIDAVNREFMAEFKHKGQWA